MSSERKEGREIPAQRWEPVTGEWLIARTDAMITTSPVDVYAILEAPGLYCHGFDLVTGATMTAKAAERFLRKGFESRASWPPRLAVPKGDPCGAGIARAARSLGVPVEEIPLAEIEAYAAPLLAEFAKQGFGASPVPDASASEAEAESARAMIPDSYDPCPCGSGAKYKFCCKRIFWGVVHAMAAAEEGDHREALRWMQEAERIAGPSAEVLCRYAIVYSRFDTAKADDYLRRCLEKNPRHPRAHYLLGIEHRRHGRIAAAIGEYEQAIASYPRTDRFHLNETWNNLGRAYLEALPALPARAPAP